MRLKVLILFFILSINLFSLTNAQIPNDCDSSMISYWKLDNNSLDSLGKNDAVGSVKKYVNETNPPLFKVNYSAEFDSTKSLKVKDMDEEIDLKKSFTINFWVSTSGGIITTPRIILDKTVYSAQINPTKYLIFSIGPKNISSSFHLAANRFYFVSLVHDLTKSELTLYLDGVKDNSVVYSGGSLLGYSSTDLVFAKNFSGYLDEIAFYDRALASNEIWSAFDKTNSGKDYCYTQGGGGTSGTKTTFTIDGCFIDGLSISAGSCSKQGNYYCTTNKVAQDTIKVLGACSLGKTWNTVLKYCCPSGYLCDGTSLTCKQRAIDCTTYKEKAGCDGEQCFWVDNGDGTGVCTNNAADYSCDIYPDKPKCEEDFWNLGKTGLGTDVCGKVFLDNVGQEFVVPMANCTCEWDGIDCSFSYSVVSSIYGAGGPDQFKCSKDYTVGDCVDGVQKVNWGATSNIIEGFAGGIPPEILALAGCSVSEAERSCGNAVVKLPFFGIFSLIMSVFILGIFYLRKIYKS